MKLSKKWLILPLALLVACSSDDSSPVSTGDSANSQGDPTSSPSGDNNGGNGGENGGPVTVSLPSTANAAIPEAQYPIWKSLWVVSMKQEVDGGSTLDYAAFADYPNAMRVWWDNGDSKCEVTGMTKLDGKDFTSWMNTHTGCSVSEGIGYGMLIALFNGDRTTFNGLWDYNRGARALAPGNNKGLMPWQLASFRRALSTSAALDADLDIASSLVLASYIWGDQAYLEDAKIIINDIYDRGINPENYLIYPGPNWKTKNVYNMSYFSPVAFRLFAMVDGAHPWNDVLNANYEYMKKVQDAGATQAVFPDWSNAAGEPADPMNGSASVTYEMYFKESVRIPWRIAWDYYWYADERAGNILKKLGDFVAQKSGNDPANYPKVAYNYSTGAEASDCATCGTTGEHFLGAACLSGFGVNSAWTDACTSYFNGFEMSTTAGYNGTYFKQILQMMYSSLLNGKFVKPNF